MDCLFCSSKFRDKFDLERHYQKHTKECPHLCPKCPKELSSIKDLNYHLETHRPREDTKVECNLSETKSLCKSYLERHEGTENSKCELCGKKFVTRRSLRQHVNLHKNINAFACSICSKAFNYLGNQKRHIKEVHGIKLHKCHICGKMFSSKTNLSRHLMQHNQQREHFQCDKCPRIFLTKLAFEEHRSIHQDLDYTFKCDKCEQSFLTSRKLRAHKSGIHLDKACIFTCVFCGKQFSVYSRLEPHLIRHTLERPYFCKVCPAEFNQSSSLCYHDKATHCKNREQFKCDMCAKSYLTKQALDNHIRHHTGELHFKCEILGCGMQFVSSRLRRFHFLKVHVGKQFSCTTCGKKFLTTAKLRNHVLIHSDFKGFQCELCGTSFKQPTNLTKHKRTVHV